MREKSTVCGIPCQLISQGDGGPVLFWGIGAQDEEEWQTVPRGLEAACGEAPWTLVVYQAEDWNRAFSPWPAPPAFGNQPFSGGGGETLDWLLRACLPWAKERLGEIPRERRFVGGYSLAGLFSLWAFYESGAFRGAASVSGSLWFPGWDDWAAVHTAPADSLIYLSLGDREEKTRNRRMAAVGDCTRRQYARLQSDEGVLRCTLEWNPGGHFQEPQARTARGFAWLLRQFR